MNQEIQKSVEEVANAIEKLNQTFENHAKSLKERGDADQLVQWITATRAMQDSGQIYLNWAVHYSRLSDTAQSVDPSLDEDWALDV